MLIQLFIAFGVLIPLLMLCYLAWDARNNPNGIF